MDQERYRHLESNYDAKLTNEEIDYGWHFCPDWDFMLIAPGMPEYLACHCDLSKPYYYPNA